MCHLEGKSVETILEGPQVDHLKLPLEELLYLRLGRFFDQLEGTQVTDLYRVVLDEVDRAVFRQAIERNHGHLNAAAQFLGLDRNTVARKVKRLKVLNSLGNSVSGTDGKDDTPK